MRIGKNKSTMKQMAYARQLWGGQGKTKKQIALNSGYSATTAASITTHVENKPGFQNAMSALALESNNVAVSILHEFKRRGVKDFSDKNLISALNAIGLAWSKFNDRTAPKESRNPTGNRLRTVILQQVENQTITTSPATPTPSIPSGKSGVIDNGVIETPPVDLDF